MGAFVVGSRQADAARRQTIEAEERALRHRSRAYFAVAEVAHDLMANLRPTLAELENALISLIFAFSDAEFDAAINAMNAVPLHDLGNAEAIRSFVAIKDLSRYFSMTIDNLMSPETPDDPRGADPLGVQTKDEMRLSAMRLITNVQTQFEILRTSLKLD